MDHSEDDGLVHSPDIIENPRHVLKVDKNNVGLISFSIFSDDDSLDIKPPQAKSEHRYKEKKKHKKHSHERRYKEKHRDYIEDPEPRRRDYRESKYGESKAYHKEKEYYKQRDSRGEYRDRKEEPSRSRRSTPEEQKDMAESDRILEDLRNRLISRRSQNDQPETTASRGSRKDESYERKEKHHSRDRRQLVEYEDEYEHRSSKKSRSHRPPVDAEVEARRKKFLEVDRDEKIRKEKARLDLEARREQHRQKETTKSREVSLSPPPEKKKKRYESSEERQPAEDVVMLSSEHSHAEDEGLQDVSESEESKSDISKESEEFEMSPIPVDQLEKSDRRNEHSESRSKSRSVSKSPSRSRSRSQRSRSTRSSRSSSSGTRSDSESRSDQSDDEKKSPEPEDVKKGEPEKPAEEAKEEPAGEKEEELPCYYPALQGCRSVEEFQCLNRIEEGTYGVVYRAKDKRTDEVVALKRLKMEKEKEGFPITSLREINTLLKGQHPNIVTVREIVVGSNMDKIFIVMDYVEHDLKSLIETMKHKKQVFLPGEVKCLIQQLIRAVAHLHDNWILHRDLKTSNLLLSHKGILKVGDFGLAREYGSPLKEYTSIVVTLWYRAPELLLGCKEYSTPIDVWSVGCIFAELLAMGALFPGKSEVDQLNRIFKDLGTPNERVWPGYDQLPLVKKMTFTDYPVSQLRKKFATLTSELGLSLLQGLLTYDPKERLTAETALKHSYFKELPLPIDPAMFPTWPAKSEVGWKRAMATSPKPPSGGMQYKKLVRLLNAFCEDFWLMKFPFHRESMTKILGSP